MIWNNGQKSNSLGSLMKLFVHEHLWSSVWLNTTVEANQAAMKTVTSPAKSPSHNYMGLVSSHNIDIS